MTLASLAATLGALHRPPYPPDSGPRLRAAFPRLGEPSPLPDPSARPMPRGRCSGCGEVCPLPPFGDGFCFMCATEGPPGDRTPTGGALAEDADARRAEEPWDEDDPIACEVRDLFDDMQREHAPCIARAFFFDSRRPTRMRKRAQPVPEPAEREERQGAATRSRLEKPPTEQRGAAQPRGSHPTGTARRPGEKAKHDPRLPEHVKIALLICLLSGMPARMSARAVGVGKDTAARWQHRLRTGRVPQDTAIRVAALARQATEAA